MYEAGEKEKRERGTGSDRNPGTNAELDRSDPSRTSKSDRRHWRKEATTGNLRKKSLHCYPNNHHQQKPNRPAVTPANPRGRGVQPRAYNTRDPRDPSGTIELAALKHDLEIQAAVERGEALVEILEVQIRGLVLDEALLQVLIEDEDLDVVFQAGDVLGDGDVLLDVDGEGAERLAVGRVLVGRLRVDGGDGAALGDLPRVRHAGDGVVAREVRDEHLASVLGGDGRAEGGEGDEEGWFVHLFFSFFLSFFLVLGGLELVSWVFEGFCFISRLNGMRKRMR